MTTHRRTGLLGGTFDPIHRGHLDVADVARGVLRLDEILLVPSRLPPHRESGPKASAYHRFAMVALAALTRDYLCASDLELESPGPSYTSQTIDRVLESGRDRRNLFFIAGGDAFAEIATWRNYPAILDQCHFAVVARPGHALGDLAGRLPDLAGRMHWIRKAGPLVQPPPPPGPPAIHVIAERTSDVSSTQIRRRLAGGDPIDELVPAEVDTYIRRHRLYEPDAAGRGRS